MTTRLFRSTGALLSLASAAFAQDQADLAKAAQNPVAAMISLPFQNNTLFGVGPDDDVANVLNIQPVIPFTIGIVVMIVFGAPFLAFTRPLGRLKQATLLTASSVATRRERAAERELLRRNMAAATDAEATAAADVPEAFKLHAAARKLSTFLISRAAIVPVAAAALLPLVAAGATQLPVKDLLEVARGLLSL